ncbi:MAG: pilus assembly protein PilP [Bacteriovoracaceae bacterium]|jgi:type IV pilus assembly protein PilP|nr:hypothetical protein [Halobacteriovoraceae bacterium]MDP7321306.1 pilus assembly protein PilP [Bacteriovoracaceae bacterium]|tara:strand:- start:391 stop:840 length:450 start_codon:yes stop_codon:yes gene_type:complete
MKIFFYIIFSHLILNLAVQARTDEIFNGHTSIKEPFELRDPFQPPKFKSKKNKRSVQRARGVLNNIPKLEEKFDLDKLIISGVLIGKERRVMVKIQGKKGVYTLKEGERFGVDGPEIKAILPGGVILVERITNIYGEPEYIETVVPISK